jgi:hypothetical protein
MQAVTGMLPFDNVGNAHGGKRRIAFHEQVGVLVVITEEPFGRGIPSGRRMPQDYAEYNSRHHATSNGRITKAIWQRSA